jgi:diaminopimelate epimerase
MIRKFFKYQGTGNDFIIIDARDEKFDIDNSTIASLCNRRMGIGADGLMILSLESGYDFRMTYYNSDGNESTMCGNGGRCMVAFAKQLGLIKNTAKFIAIDGEHDATIDENNQVKLHMNNVTDIQFHDAYTILNTGSPHYVKWIKDTQSCNVFNEGRIIRNEPRFMPSGINVNFAAITNNILHVRTYERGVEDETLSCGTGVTAAAIASTCSQTGTFHIDVITPGGNLMVDFAKDSSTSATDVYLTGSATFVFTGSIEV